MMANINLEKRYTASTLRQIVNPVVFILLSLVFSSIFIIIKGFNPFAVYSKMITYSYANRTGIANSVMAGIPLIFCGMSVAFASRMQLNNIGAEGQYAMGAIIGGGFVLFSPDMPMLLRSLLMLILCAAGGALWSLIAALMKAYWNVSETIVTLMLNYIALLYLEYLTYGPWKAPGQTTPTTKTIPIDMHLPYIGNTGISTSFLLAIMLAIFLFLFYRYSTVGYQIDMIKYSKKAAIYSGVDVRKYIVLVLALSGAIAGLAGYAQIAGNVHRLQARLPAGAGYTGIVIAYLSQHNPLVIILISILFGGLVNSGSALQIMGIPSQIVTMIQGSMMIFVIAGQFFNKYKIAIYKSSKQSQDVI